MHTLIVFLSLLTVCSGLFGGLIDNTNWDTLQIKWGLNFFEAFYNMPTTVQKALVYGFTKISDCDLKSPWRGARYTLDNTHAVILIYDIRGNLAGIQTALPKNLTGGYPTSSIKPPFIEDGDTWVLTAYFTDPAKICTTGRSDSEVAAERIGSNLYLQNSTSPESSLLIPRFQKDIVGTQWVEGQCFKTMGQHYWWNYSDDMSCDSIFPYFLLYNDGQLNGFGFTFPVGLTHSIYEHPTYEVLPKFIKSVPKCFASIETFSTLHVYLTDYVLLNLC